LTVLGLHYSLEFSRKLFYEIDKQSNGYISFEDFSALKGESESIRRLKNGPKSLSLIRNTKK
jgi:Ca2+-binding EF-hand superfamily protein